MRKTGIFLWLFLTAEWCMAGDVLAVRDSLFAGRLPSDRMEDGHVYNPAAFGWLRKSRSAGLSFRGRLDGAEGLYPQFDGDGGHVFRAEAAGYGVETGKIMYSGSAAWESGVRRNTRRTDVRDEYLLGPYLVADSLGGDYRHESYHLGGSAAFYKGRGIYGFRAAYRGTTAFRKADPRPENTISELALNPGMVLSARRWDFGLFLNYVFYKQHLSVKIEESSRKDMFYVLKGFGLYDYRFSGVGTSFSRYYRSHEYGGGLQARQRKDSGFSFRAAYGQRKMEVEESDLRLPFLLREKKAEGEIGWKTAVGEKNLLVVSARGRLMWQAGTERNYEKKTSDNQTGMYVWQLLGEADKYKRRRIDWETSVLLQRRTSSSLACWYGAVVSGEADLERYLYPAYRQQLSGVKGSLLAGALRRLGKGTLEAVVSGGYRKNLAATLEAPPAEEVMADFVLPEYDFRKRDRFDTRLEVGYVQPLKGCLSLALEAAGEYAASPQGDSCWKGEAGISFIF